LPKRQAHTEKDQNDIQSIWARVGAQTFGRTHALSNLHGLYKNYFIACTEESKVEKSQKVCEIS
jgi:hypothetical protein